MLRASKVEQSLGRWKWEERLHLFPVLSVTGTISGTKAEESIGKGKNLSNFHWEAQRGAALAPHSKFYEVLQLTLSRSADSLLGVLGPQGQRRGPAAYSVLLVCIRCFL